jgi:hypothetical protein
MKTLITSLVLVCILVQTVFGGLQDSVIICLGGGHSHDQEVASPTTSAPCCEGCEHNDQWPATAVETSHQDCGCTDIELTLVELRSTTRTLNNPTKPIDAEAAPRSPIVAMCTVANGHRGLPILQPRMSLHRAHCVGTLRLAIVRSTRLLL